jgi:hypothetical protein
VHYLSPSELTSVELASVELASVELASVELASFESPRDHPLKHTVCTYHYITELLRKEFQRLACVFGCVPISILFCNSVVTSPSCLFRL